MPAKENSRDDRHERLPRILGPRSLSPRVRVGLIRARVPR